MLQNLKKISLLLNKKLKFSLWILFISNIIAVAIEFISLSMLGVFILILNDPNSFSNELNIKFIQEIVDNFAYNRLILTTALLLFLLILIKNSYSLFNTYLENKIKINIVKFNFEKLYLNFLNSDYLYINKKNPSELLNKFNQVIPKAVETIFFCFFLFREILISFYILILLIYTSSEGAILSLAFFILAIFLFTFLYKKKISEYGKKQIIFEQRVFQSILETFNNFKIIKLINKNIFFTQRVIFNIQNILKFQMFHVILGKIPRAIFESLVFLLILILFFYLYIYDINFESLLPFIVILFVGFLRLLPSFSNITALYNSVRFFRFQVYELLNEFENIEKIKFEKNLCTNKKIFKETIEELSLQNISFRYTKNKKFELKNINLHFEKGKIYSIIGRSGSGKSTIIDIISGLIKPDEGNIKINKNDKTENLNWYNLISYVPQNIYLSDQSIVNNITIGEADDDIDLNRFWNSVKAAELEEFINQQEKKEKQLVGDAGRQISGGQKQRIGLARAFYKENQILILDEATNAIDIINEKKILENLKLLKKDKIIIIVAHDQKLITYSDKIIVVNNGQILKILDNKDFDINEFENYFEKDEKSQ